MHSAMRGGNGSEGKEDDDGEEKKGLLAFNKIYEQLARRSHDAYLWLTLIKRSFYTRK
jgi:hypothetical protein